MKYAFMPFHMAFLLPFESRLVRFRVVERKGFGGMSGSAVPRPDDDWASRGRLRAQLDPGAVRTGGMRISLYGADSVSVVRSNKSSPMGVSKSDA